MVVTETFVLVHQVLVTHRTDCAAWSHQSYFWQDIGKKAILLKFRESVSDVLPSLRNDFLRSDAILEKFLIARGYNLHEAEEMFRKTVEWRQANGVETILERPFCHEMDPYYEVLFTGFDKLGHPVFMGQAGQWDVLGILESKSKAEIAIIAVQLIEKGLDLLRMISENGKPITKGFLIVDCANFDYTLLAHPKVITMGLTLLRELCQMSLNYYPECIEKVVVVNVTPMFQLLWVLIKPMLPRATLAKVAIHGNNADRWKKCLLEHIGPSVLPSQYGGADTTGLLDCRFEPDKDFNPKRHLELLPPEDLLECYIEPRKSFSVEITAKRGDRIVWNFKTEGRDIGFQVECGDDHVIIESCRVDAHKFIQKGSLYCPCEAKYTFTWDNSYSYVSGKKLFYAVIARNIT